MDGQGLDLVIGESSLSGAESQEWNGEKVIVLSFTSEPREEESQDLSITMTPERALEIISDLTCALRANLRQS